MMQMQALLKRKTYKGVLRSLGETNAGKGSRKYSSILVGREKLHDVVVSQYLAQQMLQGEVIELTLACAGLVPFLIAISGYILLFAGAIFDINFLILCGFIFLVSGTVYWVKSLSSHEVYSIKVNDRLYRNGVQFDAPVPLAAGQPEKCDGQSHGFENQADTYEGKPCNTTDIPQRFNSRILGVSKLSCPQCATEALVEFETNLICGSCKTAMQVDNS